MSPRILRNLFILPIAAFLLFWSVQGQAIICQEALVSNAESGVSYYENDKGNHPVYEWLEKLKDKKTRAIIKGRIQRLEEGNLGFTRSIGQGLIELKIDYGPGYRVYLGLVGETNFVILAGGEKSTQSKDIENAKARWQDYKEYAK